MTSSDERARTHTQRHRHIGTSHRLDAACGRCGAAKIDADHDVAVVEFVTCRRRAPMRMPMATRTRKHTPASARRQRRRRRRVSLSLARSPPHLAARLLFLVREHAERNARTPSRASTRRRSPGGWAPNECKCQLANPLIAARLVVWRRVRRLMPLPDACDRSGPCKRAPGRPQTAPLGRSPPVALAKFNQLPPLCNSRPLVPGTPVASCAQIAT